MIDNYAWNVFINTGNIDAYLLSKEIVEIKSITPNVIINNIVSHPYVLAVTPIPHNKS